MQVFTSVLVLLIFFGVFVFTSIRSYKESKEEAMISVAHVIGINSIAPIRFQDNESAKKDINRA